MHARDLVAIAFAASIGCAGDPPARSEPAPVPEAPVPEEPSPPVPAQPSEPEDGRARAIREAEAFVRAQGYADTPPTVSGDDIVHEGIEGTMEDRRNMLDPHAVRATESNGEWAVVFRYRDPELAGRGRMLRLRPGQRPSFVHQDLLLSPPSE